MASDQNFLDFVLAQIENAGEVTAKKMFGENGIYSGEKLFGLNCDHQLFIKTTTSGREFIGKVIEASPYEGAKPSFLLTDKLKTELGLVNWSEFQSKNYHCQNK